MVMPNHFHGIIFIVETDRARSEPVWYGPLRRGDRPVARSEPAAAPGPQFDRGTEGDPRPLGHLSSGDRPVAPTRGPKPGSVGSMVAGFKSAVTKRINALRHLPGTPSGSAIITSTSSAVKTITTASSNIFPLTLNDGSRILCTPTKLPPSANRTRIPPRRGDRRVARSEPVVSDRPIFESSNNRDPLPPNHSSPGDRPVAPTTTQTSILWSCFHPLNKK